MVHYVDSSIAAALASGRLRPQTLKQASDNAFNPCAVLGELDAWKEQAANDYCGLWAALPLTQLQGDAAAAAGDACGTETLAELGDGLAAMMTRFDWLASLAETAARQIGAMLASRPDGRDAAAAITAALQPAIPESTGDAQIIEACADADRLDRESRDHDVASEAADATDRALAVRHRAEAKRLADEYSAKIREVAALPASSRAGEVAKARLLADLVDTEADGTLAPGAYPADCLAFSLSADILRGIAVRAGEVAGFVA